MYKKACLIDLIPTVGVDPDTIRQSLRFVVPYTTSIDHAITEFRDKFPPHVHHLYDIVVHRKNVVMVPWDFNEDPPPAIESNGITALWQQICSEANIPLYRTSWDVVKPGTVRLCGTSIEIVFKEGSSWPFEIQWNGAGYDSTNHMTLLKALIFTALRYHELVLIDREPATILADPAPVTHDDDGRPYLKRSDLQPGMMVQVKGHFFIPDGIHQVLRDHCDLLYISWNAGTNISQYTLLKAGVLVGVTAMDTENALSK
jgi:hypothetical protein